MRIELDQELVEKFPNLYRDRFANMRETAMCWGFECGNGWFQLIYKLSEKLEAMILELPEDEHKHFKASQVKEKYGILRYYLSAETDEMRDAIQEAEEESARTCEVCGKPGKMRGKYWFYVSCDKHNRDDVINE